MDEKGYRGGVGYIGDGWAADGGGGGEGRIRLEYSTLNTVAYLNTSGEEDASSPDPGSSSTLSE